MNGSLGITARGLRHEALIEEYISITGQEPLLRVATLRLDIVVRPVVHRPYGWQRHGAAARRGCTAASVVRIE